MPMINSLILKLIGLLLLKIKIHISFTIVIKKIVGERGRDQTSDLRNRLPRPRIDDDRPGRPFQLGAAWYRSLQSAGWSAEAWPFVATGGGNGGPSARAMVEPVGFPLSCGSDRRHHLLASAGAWGSRWQSCWSLRPEAIAA